MCYVVSSMERYIEYPNIPTYTRTGVYRISSRYNGMLTPTGYLPPNTAAGTAHSAHSTQQHHCRLLLLHTYTMGGHGDPSSDPALFLCVCYDYSLLLRVNLSHWLLTMRRLGVVRVAEPPPGSLGWAWYPERRLGAATWPAGVELLQNCHMLVLFGYFSSA